MSDIVRVHATEADAGERIDRVLARHLPVLSRSRIKALIEDGRATRDATRLTDPSELARAGALYTLAPPDPVAAQPRPEAIPFPILYEDADLIVLDKPAGLVVHPAPGNEDGTLVNALLGHCGDSLPGIGGERRPGIVHRLDKDTSGIMVVAKTEPALATLSAAFAARDIDRAYLALCWGLPPATASLEGDIGRDPRDRKRMAVVPARPNASGTGHAGGKFALTHLRLLRTRDAAVSLVECRLATGRTHQIRVHMATHGWPLVGDPVYLRRIPAAARTLPPDLRATALDFPRQALHAAHLGFAHPRTGAALAFATPPPADMAALLHTLDLTES